MFVVALLTLGTLHLDPGFRSFPEIAALVGEAPGELRCDPKIAHRMAFVSAKAISRGGLARALRLVVVQEGDQKVLKAADADLEREWAADVRRVMERQYARFAQLVVAAAEEREKRNLTLDDWNGPDNTGMKVLADPNSTREQRTLALDQYLGDLADMEVHLGGGARMLAALAEFPPEFPPELVERGFSVDVRPFSALSRRTLASLATNFPGLTGGPESLLVRRRVVERHTLKAWIGIIDPSGVIEPRRVASLGTWPFLNGLFGAKSLATEKNELLRLRRFATELAARRAEEREGRALVGAYAAEVAPMIGSSDYRRPSPMFSLSNLSEAWARRGHDVIQELDPESELLAGLFQSGQMTPGGPWSPTVVEGVLVLRPLARFVNGSRRFPYRALFALEATGETPEGAQRHTPGWPLPESMAGYVALAGPSDRWLTTPYRGWSATYENLDRAASSRRVITFMPATTGAESARVLRDVLAKPNPNPYTGASGQKRPEPVAVWTHRVTELPLSTQQAIIAEMHGLGDEGKVLVFSPARLQRFLGEAQMEVRVQESYQGYERSVWIFTSGSDPSASPILYGRG